MNTGKEFLTKLYNNPKSKEELEHSLDFSVGLLEKIYKVITLIIEAKDLEVDFINERSVTINKDAFIDSGLSVQLVNKILQKISDDVNLFSIDDFNYKNGNFTIYFENETTLKNLYSIKNIIENKLNDNSDKKDKDLRISQKMIVQGGKEYIPHKASVEELILLNLTGENKSKKKNGKYNYSLSLNYIKNSEPHAFNLDQIRKGLYSINRSLKKKNIGLKFRIKNDKVHVLES